jgi:hypothetical protein
MEDPGLESRLEQDIFLFFKMSRPVLGPTQLRFHWVPDFFYNGLSGRSVMLTTHFHLVPRLRMSGALLLFPLFPFYLSPKVGDECLAFTCLLNVPDD